VSASADTVLDDWNVVVAVAGIQFEQPATTQSLVLGQSRRGKQLWLTPPGQASARSPTTRDR
jgi:hypothetical protein